MVTAIAILRFQSEPPTPPPPVVETQPGEPPPTDDAPVAPRDLKVTAIAAQVMREIIVGAIAGNRRAMSNAYAKDRSGDEISPEREREK